ncbi:energy transducer TonB [Lysobacter arvi]|uniref:Energy transducer TonB n=1 Tax=Lysobacter arvi TaxID=3038776 RepID=A0ABU1C944_9GAMM|nr:energy transducer TonB [Lysobacter arvi]MDR0181708.1 energy transducer TonB [Lysobacter arvi]
MSTSAPAPHRPAFDLGRWVPAGRSFLWVLLAFVAGLVLFAFVLSTGRKDDALFRVGTPPSADAPRYSPLPAPLPAARDNASGMGAPSAEMPGEEEERPRLVETRPAAPPPTLPAPAAPAPAGPASRPEPLAGRTPAPRYPSQSLRRGESGTVLVRAQIGPDGVPSDVGVANSSGSRHLDRAAVDAVKRWRFRPALQGGQPTAGTVMVPIEFQAQR